MPTEQDKPQRDRALRRQVLDAHRTKAGIRCAKCRKRYPDTQIEVDHRNPLHRGGPDVLENLQPLCKNCHKAKGAKEARRRARGPRWPTLLKAGGITGAALPALHHVTEGVAWHTWLTGPGAWGTRTLDVAQAVHVPLEPLLHDAAAGALIGFGAAAALAFTPGLAHRWIAAGAPREQGQVATTPVPDARATRIKEAVEQLLPTGRTVTVSERDGGYLIDYKATGFRDHDDEKCIEMLAAITAKTGERWLDTWQKKDDQVLIQPRPILPTKVDHPGWQERPWHVLPIGVGPHGEVAFDLLKTAHVLVVGTTGAGKTVAIRSILGGLAWQAARGRIELVVIDPKTVELIGFATWPGVREVATDPEEMWDAPIKVAAEMHRRIAAFKHDGVPLGSHKPWVVLVDEFEQYVDVITTLAEELDEKGKPRERTTQKRAASPIRATYESLRMARKCGIHFVIGTQRADADTVLPGRVKNNLAGRLLVGRADAEASRMSFGAGTYGRDITDEMKGRATMRNGTGAPFETQLYWFPDPADADEANTEADWALLDRLKASIGTRRDTASVTHLRAENRNAGLTDLAKETP